MKWIQAGSYLIQPTKEGVPVVEIASVNGMPEDAAIVYNGGDHALFFRNHELGIILDCLNEGAKVLLNGVSEAAICETSIETGNVAPIYRVPVMHYDDKIDIKLYKRKAK